MPVEQIRERIRAAVADKGAELVRHYYTDPEFAGALFDDFGSNPEDAFVADDIVAASLLDVRFGPHAVRALLEAGSANDLLTRIPDRTAVLWDPAVDLDSSSPSWMLWDHVRAIRHVGRTRASKLLARKRTGLFPVVDSVIRARLGLGSENSWASLRSALADETLRRDIEGLRPAAAPNTPSTLRHLDVATWMRYSNSRNAKNVRQKLAMTE